MFNKPILIFCAQKLLKVYNQKQGNKMVSRGKGDLGIKDSIKIYEIQIDSF